MLGNITITKNTRLDLYLIVETMTQRRRIDYGRDGVRALEQLRRWDADPLTKSVHLINRVVDRGTVNDVLVYQSVDTLPRWVTHATRERARAAMLAQRSEVPGQLRASEAADPDLVFRTGEEAQRRREEEAE